MGKVILATGGARSGKSAWAQTAAEALGAPRAYIATCQAADEEMRARVERHRAAREGRGWATVEEPLDLTGALDRASREFAVALVDCLTLWTSNRMLDAEQRGAVCTEELIAGECRRVLTASQAFPGGVVFVSGEVGMGIVPENAVARRYRDLLGRCNQVMADGASQVTLLVCGQPLRIK